MPETSEKSFVCLFFVSRQSSCCVLLVIRLMITKLHEFLHDTKVSPRLFISFVAFLFVSSIVLLFNVLVLAKLERTHIHIEFSKKKMPKRMACASSRS